jgi:hypothetical protein
MTAHFDSLWNLLQECRSLGPRRGKLPVHTAGIAFQVGTNAPVVNSPFTIRRPTGATQTTAGKGAPKGWSAKPHRLERHWQLREPISFYALFEMSR